MIKVHVFICCSKVFCAVLVKVYNMSVRLELCVLFMCAYVCLCAWYKYYSILF